MFKKEWVKHYGWPEIIVHDQGNEFMGKAFQNMCSEQGVMTVPIDSQSPWQNGKTERAGGLVKQCLWDLEDEHPILDRREFEERWGQHFVEK